jgi:hypothetical protein
MSVEESEKVVLKNSIFSKIYSERESEIKVDKNIGKDR